MKEHFKNAVPFIIGVVIGGVVLELIHHFGKPAIDKIKASLEG